MTESVNDLISDALRRIDLLQVPVRDKSYQEWVRLQSFQEISFGAHPIVTIVEKNQGDLEKCQIAPLETEEEYAKKCPFVENSCKKKKPFEAQVTYDYAVKANPNDNNDNNLHFESRFESGNLKKATKTGPFSYDLQLREDLHTKGHTQWFYFKVENMIGGVDYEFSISNMKKKDSLYGKGMRPLMYSQHLSTVSSSGWIRCGEQISYLVNQEPGNTPTKSDYTLKFTLRFPQSGDIVYLAHSIPYTYSRLQRYIVSLKLDEKNEQYLRHKVLGKTFLGNNLDMLCISQKVSSPKELVNRKAIVFIGRVHPGETNSSWTVHGLVDFLLSDQEEAKYLRENYVVKIIPMLNPDGVIVGNHRCNYKGFDLNRQWKIDLDLQQYIPEIVITKGMIKATLESRKIEFFCDFHGHSKKHGVFIYGCNNDFTVDLEHKEKVFPFMLDKDSHIFSFQKCHFKRRKGKEGTARLVLRNEMDILNSFTLETSFAGSLRDQTHFSIHTLKELGKVFGSTVQKFLYKYPDIEKTAFDSQDLPWSKSIDYLMGEPDTKIEFFESDSSEFEDTSSDDERIIVKRKKKKSGQKIKVMDAIKRTSSQNSFISEINRSRPQTPLYTPSRSSSTTSFYSNMKAKSVGKQGYIAKKGSLSSVPDITVEESGSITAKEPNPAILKIHNLQPTIIKSNLERVPRLQTPQYPKWNSSYARNSRPPSPLCAGKRPSSASKRNANTIVIPGVTMCNAPGSNLKKIIK